MDFSDPTGTQPTAGVPGGFGGLGGGGGGPGGIADYNNYGAGASSDMAIQSDSPTQPLGVHGVGVGLVLGHQFSLGQSAGGVYYVQEDEEDPGEEEFEERRALDLIFHGQHPVLPQRGLTLRLLNGYEIIVFPNTGVRASNNREGYIFNYVLRGQKVFLRVQGPVTEGPYPHPNGYIVFQNGENQYLNMFTGKPTSLGQAHYDLAP